MGAVLRTIEQVIADAWGNDEDSVRVTLLDENENVLSVRDLTVEEARAFAHTLVLAADAVTEDRQVAAQGSGEPPAPRGDTITPSAHRRAGDVAKTPQIAAEAQHRHGCIRNPDHEGECSPWVA